MLKRTTTRLTKKKSGSVAGSSAGGSSDTGRQIEKEEYTLLRKLAIRATTHNDFTSIVIILIFMNIVILLMYDPLQVRAALPACSLVPHWWQLPPCCTCRHPQPFYAFVSCSEGCPLRRCCHAPAGPRSLPPAGEVAPPIVKPCRPVLACVAAPQDEHSSWNSTLNDIDLALNVAFSIEMLLRIFALGGIRAYLSRPWNVFDFLMVCAGYTRFVPADSGTQGVNGVRALRAMRALRPLRTITQLESLRSIVVCFLEVRHCAPRVAPFMCIFCVP